jgi:apolipoprotein N-acyltransferase
VPLFKRRTLPKTMPNRKSQTSSFLRSYFPGFHLVLLAVLSGFLVSLGFPGGWFPFISAWWAVPFGLIPLFLALEFLPNESNWLRTKQKNSTSAHGKKQRFFKSFVLCWIFGSTLASIAFFWITVPMIYFGKINTILSYFIFAAYALVSGMFFALVLLPFSFNAMRCFSRLSKPFPFILLCLISICLEIIIPRFFYWSLGSLFHNSAPLRQWAGIFGSNFLGIFVLYTGVSFAKALAELFGQSIERILKQTLIQSCIWAVLYFGGSLRLSIWNKYTEGAPKKRIAFIQPNFTFEQLSSNSFQSSNSQEQSLETLISMSEEVIASAGDQKPDLLVWPESVSPTDLGWSQEKQNVIKNLTAKTGVPILNQTVAYNQEELNQLGYQHATMYSESQLWRTDGTISDSYRKWVPIPFGETVPLEDYFPKFGNLIRRYVGNTSKVGKGTSVESIPFSDGANLAPLICFDSVSPQLTRKQVNFGGANLFVNQSNFIWMLHSNAGAQLKEMNRFRGIENGKSIVMASNTGPSTAFNPTGAEIYPSTTLVSKASGYVDVPIVNEEAFYGLFGNSPIYASTLMSLVLFMVWPQGSHRSRKRFF